MIAAAKPTIVVTMSAASNPMAGAAAQHAKLTARSVLPQNFAADNLVGRAKLGPRREPTGVEFSNARLLMVYR
jgi:hypothetical protein